MKQVKSINRFFLLLMLVHFATVVLMSVVPVKFLTNQLSIALGQLIVIIPAACYVVFKRFEPVKRIPTARLKISNILILILLSYLIMPFISFINAISMLFVENRIGGVITGLTEQPLFVSLLMLAAVPAFCEEFVFRGLFYHTYREKAGMGAVILSGFLFGLAHMNLNQFLYATLLGVVLVLVVEATGSIFASMVVHFVFNGNSVLVTYISARLVRSVEKTQELNLNGYDSRMLLASIVVLFMVGVAGASLAFLTYIWLVKRCGRTEQVKALFQRRRREDGKRTYHLVDVTLLVGIILCTAYMIYTELLY